MNVENDISDLKIKSNSACKNNVNHENINNNDEKDIIYNEKLDNLNKKIIDLNLEFLNKNLLMKNNLKLYKIRIETEINKIHKFSLANFFIELFPVIDSIECALNIFNNNDKILYPIFKMLDEIYKSLVDLLINYGLIVIKDVNVPFNPDIHQAITLKYVDNIKENHVVSIMQKGYLLHDRLLRPAMVIVSKK